VADPVTIDKAPDAPLLVVPDWKAKPPLTPDTPALNVLSAIEPLDVAIPDPDARETAPPVRTVLIPAIDTRSPPAFAVPVPTLIMISPPFPPVAAPVDTAMKPLVPELVVPVVKLSIPLVPAVPAS
jgi:hypothetical protein